MKTVQSVADFIWTFARAFFRAFIAPLLVTILVLAASVLALSGIKNVQVGGLVRVLMGRKNEMPMAIDVANSVPRERVDESGKLIPVGQADAAGMTQAAVVPIENLGFMADPKTVTFVPPGGRPVEVKLPLGVTADQVEHVVVIAPDKFLVSVKDDSGVPAAAVDELLKKYS